MNTTRPWLVFMALSIMAILTDMDLTIVNLSILTIAKATGAVSSQMQLFFSVYNISAAMVMILGGILADRILGKKIVYLIGLSFFLFGSLVSGILTSHIYYLIVGRCLQGIGFGLTISLGAVILAHIFPKEKQGTAIGLYMMFMAVAQALGPIIGGVIIEYLNWSWIFLINVFPILISLLLLLKYYQRDSVVDRSHKIDVLNFSLFGACALLLMVFVSELSQKNNLLLCVVGLFFLIVGVFYIKNEKNSSDPLFEKSLLSNHGFVNMLIVRSINMFIFGAILYFIPLYLQNIVHFSPINAGLILATMTVAMVVISPLSGILCDHSFTNHLSFLSFVLMAPSLAMLGVTRHFSSLYFIICLAFSGISVGILATTSVVSIARTVPEKMSGKAMGMFYTSILIAFALGGTTISSLSNKIASVRFAALLKGAGVQLIDFDFISDKLTTSGLISANMLEQFKIDSFYFGFNVTFWLCFVLNLVALGSMLFYFKNKNTNCLG